MFEKSFNLPWQPFSCAKPSCCSYLFDHLVTTTTSAVDVLITGLALRAEETLMMNEDKVHEIIQRWVSPPYSPTTTQLS
uniref:Uncharacterized protein n=1 Tax=Xiphophorus maculatus TaxID=8083 RepID=A0A3B5QYR8_XIPMA